LHYFLLQYGQNGRFGLRQSGFNFSIFFMVMYIFFKNILRFFFCENAK